MQDEHFTWSWTNEDSEDREHVLVQRGHGGSILLTMSEDDSPSITVGIPRETAVVLVGAVLMAMGAEDAGRWTDHAMAAAAMRDIQERAAIDPEFAVAMDKALLSRQPRNGRT